MSITPDSLAPEGEGEIRKDFIAGCPWLKSVLKEEAVNTEFEAVTVKSRCIDLDLDESEASVFKQSVIPAGPDFKKKCNFKYLPGKMFNYQVQYEI